MFTLIIETNCGVVVCQGFTQLQTYLLAIAQGAIIMAFLFSAAYLSKRYDNKLIFAFVCVNRCAPRSTLTYLIDQIISIALNSL